MACLDSRLAWRNGMRVSASIRGLMFKKPLVSTLDALSQRYFRAPSQFAKGCGIQQLSRCAIRHAWIKGQSSTIAYDFCHQVRQLSNRQILPPANIYPLLTIIVTQQVQ